MRKRIFSLVMLLVLVLPLGIFFAGCGEWSLDLTGYVADIVDAKGLGISSVQESVKTASKGGQNSKNYIVKTTRDFDSEDPNDADLEIVEFKKKHKGDKKDNDHISQDEINGDIDKLYVLDGYTFVSYVPKGKSQRPSDDELTFDTDGISLYDKTDYFSDSTRQSFIIDNQTGYVYKINNFKIKEIKGGCLLSGDDKFIYDFKINDKSEVEIFSLFKNDSVEWFSCFKDKYGNKYIQNDKLNTYDQTTNTYFYVFMPFENNHQHSKNINYELTENNEAIKLVYNSKNFYSGSSPSVGVSIVDAEIMLADGKSRKLTAEDSFDIFYDYKKTNNAEVWNSKPNHTPVDTNYSCDINRGIFRVENGVIYGYNNFKKFGEAIVLLTYDAIKNLSVIYNIRWEENMFWNVEYLEKYGVVLEFDGNSLSYYKNIWAYFKENIVKNYASATQVVDGVYSFYGDAYMGEDDHFEKTTILEDCSLSDDKTSMITYGINGNTYYDIVVEKEDGEIVVNQYVKGTYKKPQTKIILQPINK